MYKITDLMERAVLITEPELRKSLVKYLEVSTSVLVETPASISYHHNYKGGLIQHTVEVHDIAASLAISVRNSKHPINMDNIRASAILHDMGKMFLYTPSKDYVGRFVYKLKSPPDHAVLGITDFQEVTRYALPRAIHLNILSHEGGWSRTGVYPDTLEASIVASADLVSSRLESPIWQT